MADRVAHWSKFRNVGVRGEIVSMGTEITIEDHEVLDQREENQASVAEAFEKARFQPFNSPMQFVREWLFDMEYFRRESLSSADASEGELWEKFVEFGWTSNWDPSPFFDIAFLKKSPHTQGVDGLLDFLELWDSGICLSPSPIFDAGYYSVHHTDVRRARLEPYVHWLVWGIFEGRKPCSYLDLHSYGKVLESNDDRRLAIHDVESLEHFLSRHSAVSSLNLPVLTRVVGSKDIFLELLEGRCMFMTDPQILFGNLDEWVLRNPNSLQSIVLT